MIVFGPSLSPYVRKVLVFAAEKGIEVETRPGVGPNPDPEFQAASPFGMIPGLKDGDLSVSDSSVICAYMEKVRPEPSLIPSEPKAYARTLWFEEFADDVLGRPSTTMFFNRALAKRFGREPDLAAADQAEKERLPRALDYLEKVIPASGFLVEDRLTLADIAVASFFCNLEYFGVVPDAGARPRTAAYVQKLHARPTFAGLKAADRQFLAA